MVHHLIGHTVYVEHVVAAVDVGHAGGDFQRAVFAEGEGAAYAQIHAVVHRQTSFVETGVVDAQVSRVVGEGV